MCGTRSCPREGRGSTRTSWRVCVRLEAGCSPRDSRDHRERGGFRWLLPKRSRLGRVGADVRPVRRDPKAALWLVSCAAGLSVACVYTRYHHGVDVLAGLTVAAIAAAIGYRLTRGARSPQIRGGGRARAQRHPDRRVIAWRWSARAPELSRTPPPRARTERPFDHPRDRRRDA